MFRNKKSGDKFMLWLGIILDVIKCSGIVGEGFKGKNLMYGGKIFRVIKVFFN